MATTDESRLGAAVDGWMKPLLVHVGAVGGGTAAVAYAQSWVAEILLDSLPLLALGLVCWMVTFGALSWTLWEFILPSFLSARS